MNKGSNVALHLGCWQREKKKKNEMQKYTGRRNNCERKIVACVTFVLLREEREGRGVILKCRRNRVSQFGAFFIDWMMLGYFDMTA